MRGLKLLLVSLALLAALCAPALAQNSPSASQYDAGGCPPQSGVLCAQSVGGGVEDFADSTEQGTEAVNDALNDAAEASASPGAVLSSETGAPIESPRSSEARETESDGEGGGLDSIEELPETGGAPLLVLCAGVVLVGCGLLVRRVAL